MNFGNVYFILLCGIGGILVVMLVALFFISRRSQRVMQSMIDIMMEPNRARVSDAAKVLGEIMSDEMQKIATLFLNIQDILTAQIATVEKLKDEMGAQNEKMVGVANDAVLRVAQMSDRMDNTVSGLCGVVNSESWNDAACATDRFAQTVDVTLRKITETTADSASKLATIDEKIANWTETSDNLKTNLQAAIENNSEQFEKMTGAAEDMQNRLTELATSGADGFANLKDSAVNYETTLKNNAKVLATYLAKLDSFEKQSKKQLTSQMNTLTNTANLVGAQVMLTESSVEKQIRKLTEAVQNVVTSGTETETAVRGISTELSGLTNHFESEIKDFATDVVAELKTVSGVANATLGDTKTAANAFSESVKSMATGVRETLIEMNTAHTQLAGQSEGLIKMSANTTEQLRPLAELIERYHATLPDLAKVSGAAGETLTKIVGELDAKIADIRETVAKSTDDVAQSATKLEELAGNSRQQMIDLMSDYAKAVETMQTLTKQMAVARAAAPMEAIGAKPVAAPKPMASSRDFLTNSAHEFDKMYEQAIDLTRAMGNDVPDVVWQKYHDGDKTIFAKWLAKMIRAADKKQIRDRLKSDSVFKSQATQFVRAFDKILGAAKNTDMSDKLIAGLNKTDLGIIYTAMVKYL